VVEHVVVVGASLGGLRTVQSLRSSGFTGKVTLVGEEHHRPYDRPPLSKHVLSGEWQAEQAFLADDAEMARIDVDLKLGQRAVDSSSSAPASSAPRWRRRPASAGST
jgi:NADPH-dependent 2,4-dienoyl-CoA reductase/sulfur reductase-like enzyme